jgi:magnesium-transporting ATPase (P-type)
LNVFEFIHSQERLGFNTLTPNKGKSLLPPFMLQFNNPLVIILMIASLVTAVLKDPTDALVMVKMLQDVFHGLALISRTIYFLP